MKVTDLKNIELEASDNTYLKETSTPFNDKFEKFPELVMYVPLYETKK